MMARATRAMLLELVALLRNLPPERFNYGAWVGDDWSGNPDLSCGTTACAAGWATTLPSFRERGLYMGGNEQEEEWFPQVVDADGQVSWGVEAMAKVLDITYWDALQLFIPGDGAPSSDASPGEVADHIQRWVEEHQ